MSKPMLLLNRRAFTLTELLVAIVIVIIGLLGLLQSLNLAIKANLQNQLREQAVILSEQTLNNIKAMPFSIITGSYSLRLVQVPLRGANRNYYISKQVQDVSTDVSGSHNSKQLSIRVGWKYMGIDYEHNISSAIGKEDISTDN